jgi:hypothetical protein
LLLSWFKQNLPVDLVIVFSLWPNISFTSSKKTKKTTKLFWDQFSFCSPFFFKDFFMAYHPRDICLFFFQCLDRPPVSTFCRVVYRLPIIAMIHNLCFRFLHSIITNTYAGVVVGYCYLPHRRCSTNKSVLTVYPWIHVPQLVV